MAHPRRDPPPPLAALIGQSPPPALFVDFDGTLVPLAATPDAIAVPGGLAGGLETLGARLAGRLAIVSGRAPVDLARHLGPLAVAVAGSHGAALRDAGGATLGPAAEALPDAAQAALAACAERLGLRYEAKSHGGALHWREHPLAEAAALDAVAALARAHGLAVKRGKAVAELVHPGTEKGAAVRRFAAAPPFAGALPVFIGDDVTDEDGMRAAVELGGFGIAVGERPNRVARFWLADVAAVHNWLFDDRTLA